MSELIVIHIITLNDIFPKKGQSDKIKVSVRQWINFFFLQATFTLISLYSLYSSHSVQNSHASSSIHFVLFLLWQMEMDTAEYAYIYNRHS